MQELVPALDVVVLLGRASLALCAVLVAFVWTGLYFSYSQSSMVALAASTVVVTVLAGGQRTRIALALAAVALLVGGSVAFFALSREHSADRLVSGRWTLVEDTWVVFRNHPVAGVGVAFLAECAISFLQMSLILRFSNAKRLTRFTGVVAGAMIATYISLEVPYSGMSMNPARTFASALPAQIWTGLWVYFTAPPLGMLLAAELYVRQHGIHRVFCAKLYHNNDKRCIFRCNWKQLSVGSGQLSVSDT